VNLKGHNSLLKQQFSSLKPATFCPSARPGILEARFLFFFSRKNHEKNVNLKAHISLSKTAIFLTETSRFLRQREAGDSRGAFFFSCQEKSQKTLNLKDHNTLSKTAIFLTEDSHFLPQREAGGSRGALSFIFLQEKFANKREFERSQFPF
jgi:hypothetical protein